MLPDPRGQPALANQRRVREPVRARGLQPRCVQRRPPRQRVDLAAERRLGAVGESRAQMAYHAVGEEDGCEKTDCRLGG